MILLEIVKRAKTVTMFLIEICSLNRLIFTKAVKEKKSEREKKYFYLAETTKISEI